MGAEQRTKCSKLLPACHLFSPFIEVFSFCILEPFLYGKTTNIHCPPGEAGKREVQAGGYLVFHVVPACTNITAPCCGRIALQSGISAACKYEYTLVGICLTLS